MWQNSHARSSDDLDYDSMETESQTAKSQPLFTAKHNARRIFIKSTNKSAFETNTLFKAIANAWPGLNFNRIQILPSKIVCVIDAENETNVPFILANVRELETQLNYPVIAEKHDINYFNTNKSRQCSHVIATGIPLNLNLDEITTSVANVIGSPPNHVSRITSGLTGKQTHLVRIILENKQDADTIINTGLIIQNVLKINCEHPRDNSDRQRCYRCQEYHHHSSSCNNTVRCRQCSQNHGFSQCRNKDLPPFCANCKGAHMASDKNCPKWRQYIQNLKDSERKKTASEQHTRSLQQQTETIKKSYAAAAQKTEQIIRTELSQNNRQTLTSYDYKLQQLRDDLIHIIDKKIDDAFAPIRIQLNSLAQISNDVTESKYMISESRIMLNEQLTKVKNELLNNIDSKFLRVRPPLKQMQLTSIQQTPSPQPSPIETGRGAQSDSSLIDESYTDYVGTGQSDHTHDSPSSPQCHDETFANDINFSIINNTMNHESCDVLTLTHATPITPISPIPITPNSPKHLNFTKDCYPKLISFKNSCLLKNVNHCDNCKFAHCIVNDIYQSMRQNKMYTFFDEDYDKLKGMKKAKECNCCDLRSDFISTLTSKSIIRGD